MIRESLLCLEKFQAAEKRQLPENYSKNLADDAKQNIIVTILARRKCLGGGVKRIMIKSKKERGTNQ